MSTTRIALAVLALILAALLAAPARADSEGEVASIEGDAIHIVVSSGAAPAVGDAVTVMNWPDRDGNATAIGRWRVAEVQGDDVTAALVESFGVPPLVGMRALIISSHGPDFREGPEVEVPGSASSGVPGTVTEARGQEVTIRLPLDASPAVGNRVELSYSYGEDTITVGTWRVTAVLEEGRVEAEAVDARGQPSPGMDALVFATGEVVAPEAEDVPPAGTGAGGEQVAAERFAEAMRIQAKDPARALELLVDAAGLGHAEAAEKAGTAFQLGQGAPPDDTAALRFYRQAAEAGRPIAQNSYGVFLATGRGGVAVDEARAVEWYKKAAAQGEGSAQTNLCVHYAEGRGVEKMFDEALRLCRLAAAQDIPAAFDQLGWMHQFGLGVAIDLTEAFRYYERAAKLGSANGQNNLGYFYENGWGVARDFQQALYWYGQAAAQGYAWGEWNLGRVHQEGIGVPADQATAIEHFRRAARGGHQMAQDRLRQLGQTW
jgi:TPR repeat protein